MIAIDGSPFTQRLLEYIGRHREILGPALQATLLTAVAPIPAHAAQFLAQEVVSDFYRDQAEAVLAPGRATLEDAGIAVTAWHEVGRAAEVIAEVAASQGFEILVMGSHGHSAFAGLVLGSVVTGTLARCQTPVLVVR